MAGAPMVQKRVWFRSEINSILPKKFKQKLDGIMLVFSVSQTHPFLEGMNLLNNEIYWLFVEYVVQWIIWLDKWMLQANKARTRVFEEGLSINNGQPWLMKIACFNCSSLYLIILSYTRLQLLNLDRAWCSFALCHILLQVNKIAGGVTGNQSTRQSIAFQGSKYWVFLSELCCKRKLFLFFILSVFYHEQCNQSSI